MGPELSSCFHIIIEFHFTWLIRPQLKKNYVLTVSTLLRGEQQISSLPFLTNTAIHQPTLNLYYCNMISARHFYQQACTVPNQLMMN